MKKFFVPMLAVLLAISGSGFKNLTETKAKPTFETLYYYYTDGATVSSYFGPYGSHADAVSASTCNDMGATTCARGYRLNQLQGGTAGNAPIDVDTYVDPIVKNN